MRDIWLDGAAVTAAIVVSWSMAMFAKPKKASKVDASASVAISPFVMMAQQRGNLAIEYWIHP
jgi:hypothetical protein